MINFFDTYIHWIISFAEAGFQTIVATTCVSTMITPTVQYAKLIISIAGLKALLFTNG